MRREWAVRATRFGTLDDWIGEAHRRTGVIVQIESARALEDIEAIAHVPGVDALFIGPLDLSADMGHVGQPMHPKVMEAMTRAAHRCAAIGKPVGTVGGTPREVAQYRAAGFHFVALASDLGLLVGGAQAALAALRRQPGDAEVHTLSGGTVTQ